MNFPDLPHLKQLQHDLWQWPKSRAAVMVGAGFSLNAEPLPGVTSHFSTWRQLVQAMFDELYPILPSFSAAEKRKREDRFTSANALRLASEYEASFGKSKIEQLIRHQNPDTDYEPGTLHTLLLQLPWADVFTTNYDTLLERTAIPGRSYQPVTKASELKTAFSPRIVKLHGSFPSQTPFIISEEDYRTYPSDFSPFVNTVQQSLLENAFVLIGFSGDDPNFLAWTGWIRDELDKHHAPIYLVGPLSLGLAERALLDRRGVTPIDLSPLFAGVPCPNGIYATSLEWFLRSLAAARPPRPEKWPDLDRGLESAPVFTPPLILGAETSHDIPAVISGPQNPLTADIVVKVVARWRFERERYSGWLVAEETKRSHLWHRTRGWIDPLFAFTKDWPAPDKILLFREVIWRLEVSMVPLFQDWVHLLRANIDTLYLNAADSQSVFPPSSNLPSSGPTDLLDAWLEIAFVLLRDAREMYNVDQWQVIKSQIDKVILRRPQFSDRQHYESALFAIWNIDRQGAKAAIACWQPSARSPLAALWKAGILAELDELGEALTTLRYALSEIRRGLRANGRNIELLSLEGWCTYLLYSVEIAFDFRRLSPTRNEFWERWQELKALDCSPWPHKEYFEETLNAPAPKRIRREQEIRGFDPGQAHVSYHFDGENIDPYLPAFGCIRLYEQVGIPMRLPHFDLMGGALKNACRWIAPLMAFWSPALLVRAGKVDDLKTDDFLSRARVAQMDSAFAMRLYDWCLGILQRELNTFTGALVMGSSQESLFGVLPEVLSRLAFKADAEQLKKAFPLVLKFQGLLAVRSHIRLHEVSEPWFRRLFQAADSALLVEWLPDLIKSPIFDGNVHPFIPADRACPDPMSHFPVERVRESKAAFPSSLPAIEKATDWLLRRAASEDGEGWRRAIHRLTHLFHAQMMTSAQQQRLGDLLWIEKGVNGLPDLPDFALFGFLHLPAPNGVDVGGLVKNVILTLPPQTFATRNAEGKVTGCEAGHRHRFIHEVSLASKPIVQLRGEAFGTLEWTPDESKQLYDKIRTWWADDRAAGEMKFPPFVKNPVLAALEFMGTFLSRSVIPALQPDAPVWTELLDWLKEIRGLGVYPTIALPYVLAKKADQTKDVTETILGDLRSDLPEAVAAAAEATRHWINLAAIQRAPTPTPELLSTLLDRVVFRRKPGIEDCLGNITYIILEQPQSISTAQSDFLIGSLKPWFDATILPIPADGAEEFAENQRPDFRVLVGRLAGALNIWLKAKLPRRPEPPELSLWQQSCAHDPLPEVRRAFSEWDKILLGASPESCPV